MVTPLSNHEPVNWYREVKRSKSFLCLLFTLLLILVIYMMGYDDNDGGRLQPSELKYRLKKSKDAIKKQNLTVDDVTLEYEIQCVRGHIENMPPICGADGCLRLVENTPEIINLEITQGQMRDIQSIQGDLNPIHAEIAVDITKLHSFKGIRGSVGEIRPLWGQYLSVLALVTLKGEHLFVGDILQHDDEYLNTNIRIALQNILKNDGVSSGNDVCVKLFEASSLILSKSIFVMMDVPAFRLLSIGTNQGALNVLHDIHQMSCVMQPSGILVLDFDDITTEAFKQYITLYGTEIIVPFMVIEEKLYVCTYQYYVEYMEHFEKRFNFKMTTDNVFGAYFRYLIKLDQKF